MKPRTIAIGDIHGCAAALRSLLAAVAPTVEDTVVFLGDYIDRGPDSRGVVDAILELRRRCNVITLMGNHELMLLAAFQLEELSFWLECGGRETLASYRAETESPPIDETRESDSARRRRKVAAELAAIPPEHRDFFQGLLPYWETERHIFVHANYIYDWPMEEQPDHTSYWEHLHAAPPPHVSGKRVFVGHTPQLSGEVLDLGHLVCLDTYCCGGGWLTAYDVDTGETWQADAAGRVRDRSTES